MNAFLFRLKRDSRGAGALEFAIAAPIIIMAVIGFAQVGTLFFANAGLRSAVGEGARLATLFPRPTNAQIQARMTARRFGLNGGTVPTPTITPGIADGANYLDITMRYTTTMNFVFFTSPPVTLQQTRRVYVHALVCGTPGVTCTSL